MIDALAQDVTVPLWLLMGLSGYHRALQVGGKAYRRRQRQKQRDGSR